MADDLFDVKITVNGAVVTSNATNPTEKTIDGIMTSMTAQAKALLKAESPEDVPTIKIDPGYIGT